MFGSDAGTPLVVLVAKHAFAGNQVGPGALRAGGLVGAVKIHQQMVRCGVLHGALVEVDHLLIVGVHEVDLDAGDAPLLVQRESHVLLRGGVIPAEPEEHLHVAVFGVADDGGHVDIGGGPGDVGVGIHGVAIPGPIHDHVLPAHVGGKLGEVLHGGGVHAHFEVGVGSVIAAPPAVPGGTAGLDPGSVFEGAGFAEVEDQIGFDEVAGAVADHERPPGRVAGRGRPHDDAGLGGARRMRGNQGVGRAGGGEVHAGPIGEIGLGDGQVSRLTNFNSKR